MKYKTGSVREIQLQLLSDGIHVSEYALRQWIKSGLLPAVYTGCKALISYDKVLEILGVPTVNTAFDSTTV